jgi:uncharacterized membrane protein
MKKFFDSLRSTILAGIIFLIPIFVLILLLEKAYKALSGFGAQLSDFLGLKSIGGVGAVSIATTLILMAIFYFCGLLVRIAMFTNMRAWVENNVLQYIPGYLNYKVQMEEKITKRKQPDQPALVRVGEVSRPCLLVETSGSKCTVFVPNTPDTHSGEVWIVDKEQVTVLAMTDKVFTTSLQRSGKGLMKM